MKKGKTNQHKEESYENLEPYLFQFKAMNGNLINLFKTGINSGK